MAIRSSRDGDYDELADHQPVLAACYRAATAGAQLLGAQPGQPVMRVLAALPPTAASAAAKLVAEVRGVNIHAERAVDGRDRPQLERLCRYLARPPLSHDRLSVLPDGRVRLALKSKWADSTTAVVLSPLDLLSRLCVLVPAPGFHLTRYAGVLSSHASLRREVVPKAVLDPERCKTAAIAVRRSRPQARWAGAGRAAANGGKKALGLVTAPRVRRGPFGVSTLPARYDAHHDGRADSVGDRARVGAPRFGRPASAAASNTRSAGPAHWHLRPDSGT